MNSYEIVCRSLNMEELEKYVSEVTGESEEVRL